MNKIKAIIKLMRIKHYIKNVLVIVPVFFSGNLLSGNFAVQALIAFVAFSLMASSVYIINDIKDVEKDRLHATKKKRPLASGEIKIKEGLALAIFLILAACVITIYGVGLSHNHPLIFLLTYLVINLLYSVGGLKNIPILDVFMLSLGFILRVTYGAAFTGIEVSKWLYLTIFAFSFYMGFGKRRNELAQNGSLTRSVNKHYTKDFLDKNMYMCLTLCIVFYSLWAIDPLHKNQLLLWTVPLLLLIMISYSLSIEKAKSSGDPVSVVFENRSLQILVLIYAAIIVGAVYL